MFPLLRSQRTSLISLYKLRDVVTRVKIKVDDTLDSSEAVFVLDDDPEAGYSGWGEEAVSAVFKPLQSPPQIDIKTEDDELKLDDLYLDPDTLLTIQERAKAKGKPSVLVSSHQKETHSSPL